MATKRCEISMRESYLLLTVEFWRYLT